MLVPVYMKRNKSTLIRINQAIWRVQANWEPPFFDISSRKIGMFVKFLLSYSTLTNQHPIQTVAESLGFLVELELHRQEEKQWL